MCKAAAGIKQVIENYDNEMNITPSSVQHTTRKSSEDEMEIINDLITISPFKYQAGRTHQSFNDIKRSPTLYLNVNEFHEWLRKKKQTISLV